MKGEEKKTQLAFSVEPSGVTGRGRRRAYVYAGLGDLIRFTSRIWPSQDHLEDELLVGW